MRTSLTFLSLALALAVDASEAQTVYKLVDKQGNIVFSDTPVTGAEAVEIQPTSTVTMAPVKLPAETAPDASMPVGYQKVVINTPSNEAVFSNHPGPVIIAGSSTPPLKSGHKYRFLINGAPTAPLAEPHYALEQAERGDYSVILEIVDSNLHAVAQSRSITFYMKKHSKLFKKPTAPAPSAR